MSDETAETAETRAQQAVVASVITAFCCGALSIAAIQRAGESQDQSMRAMCRTDYAVAVMAQQNPELLPLVSGRTPEQVKDLPQCQE